MSYLYKVQHCVRLSRSQQAGQQNLQPYQRQKELTPSADASISGLQTKQRYACAKPSAFLKQLSRSCCPAAEAEVAYKHCIEKVQHEDRDDH